MTLHGEASKTALYRMLERVERPLMREWSVKSIDGTLFDDRFLTSFARHALGPGPSRTLREMWTSLGAPEPAIQVLDAVQSRAQAVHFGYEQDAQGVVLKSYLEFSSMAGVTPDLIFLAIKWRGTDAWGVSRYMSRFDLPLAARNSLIGDVLSGDAVLHDVMQRFGATPDLPRLLEVIEPGTPRRSLDINLVDQEMCVGDRAADLVQLLGRSEQAQDFVARHAGARLGHVAAGIARNGRGFATLYFGAHALNGVS